MPLSSIQTGARGERLDTLAAMLAQLNRRIRAESADRATALALRERFGPALPSIGETRTAILSQLGRGRVPNQTLLALYGALGDLSEMLTAPLPAADVSPLSRPAARKARQRAERLEASARKMLGAIGKALAAGAAVTAASALMATPAAAGCSTVGTTTICDGDLSGGVYTGWPLTDDLTVHNLTTDIQPVGLPGVRLASSGGNGSGGGAWSDGDNGSGAKSLDLSVSDPDNSIIASSSGGVFVYSQGGRGGNGGGAGLGGSGGDGGRGGAGGGIVADVAIDIETTGSSVHGIVALSAGGNGGKGGSFAFGIGSAGDGGPGGAGGAVSVNFGANSIVTNGVGADGVFASSVGGNGGSAGDCDVAICGSSGGGNSAIGGTVSVTTVDGSTITANGAFSKAIRASSIGGFGGNGGDSYFAAGFASNGGSAGDGGAVYVTNGGTLTTWGVNGDAIFAQSVGGGGGDGGDTGISLFSLGGGGAQGGSGGYVQVINESTGVIETWNTFSRGIYAQSVGGGGGAGGSASSLISVGGNGSGTSDGGAVQVANAGSIITHGGGSQAIFAQSIGGGGGDGGGASGLAAVGGTGGSGGDSAAVTVANSGYLGTSGADASAIYAQSIGGGGGDGAGSGGMISIGGSGGAGGDSGVVTVTNNGSIQTAGDRSNGVFAQSVGGGGGNGGGAASFGAFLNISVGGAGGLGGDGDVVTITTTDTSDIRTEGERSAAIFAQSVGGGGGNGGYGAGGAVGVFGALSIAVGGGGGDGGDGAAVSVHADGYLETLGADSQGVFAQSVGGGGGNGGFAVAAALAGGPVAASGSVAVGGAGAGAGDGEAVTVLNQADISTTGDRSSGLHAQSVGGGGGNGGWSGAIAGAGGAAAGAISVGVGGTAGGGGDGGAVDVGNFGDIHTRGVDAYGVLAQSVGGGGGTGGFSVSGAVGGGKVAGGLSFALGGEGGLGGDGDGVRVDSEGLILTEGDRSIGILAQSLGGGGGAGGWSGGLAVGAGGVGGAGSVTVGGFGAAGGDGWTVEVQSDTEIRTRGHDAHGVFAQSVGGGGGAGGFSLGAAVGAGKTGVGATITVGGGGGLGGDANTVTVNSTGDIRTGGDRATGITAQSLGGGGGNGGFTGSIAVGAGTTGAAVTVGIGGFGGIGGDGALVTLTSSGDIDTTGVDAQGLFAQSIGGGGGNGGFSAAAGVAAGTNAGAGSLTIGGFGGAAGDGGAVILTNTGSVETSGDRSHAVHGQSIGGGGGNGGIAASFTAAFSSSTPVSLGLNLGGFGGAGGNAAGVTIISADATTEGDGAHAIFGQSVGGGGGTGGFSISGALSAGGSNSIALNANIGGFGGAGGDAGDVSVTADGVTWTSGEGSHGVFAQSVGGSGGDGGWAGTLTGALGSGKSVTLGATLGGMGGAGGLAGDVTVNSDGQILTEGDASHAVFAQSVGGGGGTGGFTVAANFGATKATNIGLTMGGSGGGAGEAGDVFVTVTDTINTRGDGSIGVFAQSVGGGGGAGGSAGSIALSGSQSVNLTANMGGFGGNGTTGGLVDVDNSGAIWTIGEMSHAIFAQSVGGGGGHGGMAGIDETEWSDYLAGGSGSVSFGSRSQNISLSMGGSGGAGNDGGAVRVENSGVIVTEGPLSHAIYAQSVGGGGGDAGVATAASGAFGAGKNGTYSVAMGGFGGTAGDGDLVEVLNSGAIRTRRDGSAGIFAQSVGGGGGAGGDARGYSMSFSPSKSKGATSVSVSLGGYGGAAGDGGDVDVENSGQILTDGAFSYGVFAQSVGGGGGTGGLVSTGGDEIIWVVDQINKGDAKGGQIAIGGSGAAGGDGGLVTVTNSGLIYTGGQQAHGVFAQSVGGGGGNGGSGLAGEVSVGGQGGAAGDGGDVHVINTGAIITIDDMAKGILAQSVGGGGGIGGATDYDGDDNYSWRSEVSATMSTVGNLQATIDFVQSVSAPAFGIGIGGMGGAAGDGGLVTVENHGSIQTAGDFATGIFAQSVGGGGGQGGEGVFTGVGQVIFSGLGGNAGDGGDVIVTNTGDITTSGYGAYGVFAQSVGGGGGLAGDYSLGIASWGDLSSYGGEDYSDLLSLQLNPIHANGGDGGDVTVTNTGTIRVNGDGAVGIFAQSVGGGGGLFGGKLLLGFIGSMEGVGEGGRVTVIQNGDVIVAGKNAIGAVFQSASKDGDQDITATMNGAVKGGSVYGMGVLIDGGLNNTLTLNGITWADSNLAITATGGNDTVIANKGLIGNVDLGLGTNRLTNTANSFFLSLDYVRLNGGALVNQGLLTPGDAGKVQVTNVTGSFVQSASGEMLTDLDLLRTGKSGEIDRLNLTGSINIQGEFTLNILNPGYALPGDHTVTILDGSGTLTQSGVVLNKPTSAVASFRLAATSQDLNLNYAIDFSPTGLNNNQTALGDHINTIQLAGSSPTFAPIAAELFYVPTVTDLANIYDSFSPQTYGAQQAAQIFAGQQFADSMFSCQRPSAGVRFSETGCVWVKPAARRLELSATSSAMAFDEQSTGLSGGFEAALGASGWRIGGALSGEAVDGGVRNRTSADGQRFQLGLVAKRDPAAGVGFGLALHGGQSEMDTTRLILLPSGPRWAEATQAITFMAATARASYRWGSDQGYLKPMLEVSAVKVETAGFTERGAGALNLVVPDQDDTYSRVSFKVEAGGEFKAGGAVVRPYGRAGVTTSADAREALFTAAFEGAPAAAAAGFSVNPGLDETTVDAEAGVAIVGPWASGRLAWTGQFGDRTDNQTLSLKLAVPF